MAVVVSGGDMQEFEGRIMSYIVLCAIIAAFGGLMFGYIGISGEMTSMDDFLEKFFHAVYERKRSVQANNYCKYDNQYLQLFTSSLYLAALVASFGAMKVCSKFGRRPTMQLASCFFLVGVILNAAATDIAMLIFGRLFPGAGVGFANQTSEGPLKKLMKRSSRLPLIIAIMMQVFQQFTGINAIMFYAPVLFQTVGFKNDASLLSSVITRLVNVFSTLVSVYVVDRAGRRVLLLEACVQMFITQVTNSVLSS
ncbi:hypothetical protein HHK36_026696 [Tetracentron sinense]|uniref:Major facilitator superfamily (MFS) profile domain-containing protein n=1 Tax=Tetracentron sinense TaxID=13715 RepID=A0A834YHB9_TETSI|nr:hypothetical protein HHK36_026696 [Tetracentron sinense]